MTLRLAGTLAIAIVLAACSSEGPTTPKKIEQLPRSLSSVEQQIAEGSTGFGLALLREVNEQTAPGTNVFISPLSASMALGMTATGAAGETPDSMRIVLGYQSADLQEMDESYRSLIDLLRGLDPSVDFRIANSIWYRNDLSVEQSFVDATKKYFDAEVASLDFGSPGAIGTINDWVKSSTNEKIDKIVNEIPPDMVMYLINAIYFKGSWTAQFDKGIAFDGGRADFTGISRDGGLAISTVDQKTFVNVDEEGTEAAAVTPVGNYDNFGAVPSPPRRSPVPLRDPRTVLGDAPLHRQDGDATRLNFAAIEATDASEDQIANSIPCPGVRYSMRSAEDAERFATALGALEKCWGDPDRVRRCTTQLYILAGRHAPRPSPST